ncbi:hypothetical protein [Halalkalibacillus sediminis]|uniref:hypothetical protein n=1 Tax=Halalkalibacillus sediminis TaxID=2018042 RepID=UPI001EE4BA39|nr:hypothetical protein [Halalkalibacillus sediminis]
MNYWDPTGRVPAEVRAQENFTEYVEVGNYQEQWYYDFQSHYTVGEQTQNYQEQVSEEAITLTWDVVTTVGWHYTATHRANLMEGGMLQPVNRSPEDHYWYETTRTGYEKVTTAEELMERNYETLIKHGEVPEGSTQVFSESMSFHNPQEKLKTLMKPGNFNILSYVLGKIKDNGTTNQLNKYTMGNQAYINKVNELVDKNGAYNTLELIMDDVEFREEDFNNMKYSYDERYREFYQKFNELVLSRNPKSYKGYRHTDDNPAPHFYYSDTFERAHYFRNKLNKAPQTLEELIEFNKNNPDKQWKLLKPIKSAFHMNTSVYNVKFVSYDGHFEGVYNKERQLLTKENNPIDMGTYNLVDASDGGGHNKYDVTPYYEFGNVKEIEGLGMGEEASRAFNNWYDYKFGNENDFKYKQSPRENYSEIKSQIEQYKPVPTMHKLPLPELPSL